jgi:hypothetical protein
LSIRTTCAPVLGLTIPEAVLVNDDEVIE